MKTDLRFLAPSQTFDEVTQRICFRIPVTILSISEKMIIRNIYNNENKGVECRDIVLEMCDSTGNIIQEEGIMWEKTYNSFEKGNLSLPYTTHAIFRRTFVDDGFEIVVYALDASNAIIKFLGSTATNETNEKIEFQKKYKDFFDWIALYCRK